jgi:nitroimidazol reductase NimA-like FMN-containing flavoprotein (pyridoxamine 5'-phosphate oxidase superfamily)
MIITEMKWQECVDFLSSHRLGRLACTKDNWAYVVPIHYAFAENWFYGFSLPGQKVEWMRDNPHVCIEVDEFQEHRCWESVIARGTYQELPDTEEWHEERMRAWAALQHHNDWWEPGGSKPQSRELKVVPTVVFFRVIVQELTGRKVIGDEWKQEAVA